jgi:uncharacterized protein
VSVYFFDSSAIVKRYVKETGTDWVIGITNPAQGEAIYVARIAGAEVVSAITRRGRSGDISQAAMARAIAEFRNDFAREYRVLEITPALIARAMSLAETHALRGYDAVQLTAALEVNDRCLVLAIPALTLISADKALNTAAKAEGLVVEDPNAH